MGLLTPRRDRHGVRYYGPDLLARLEFIGLARRLGLSVASVRELVDLIDAEGGHASAARFLQRCTERIAQLRREIRLLEDAVQRFEFTPLPSNQDAARRTASAAELAAQAGCAANTCVR